MPMTFQTVDEIRKFLRDHDSEERTVADADAMRDLEYDITGQDDPDTATRLGCGADDSYDKSGQRRLSRFNEAGETRW